MLTSRATVAIERPARYGKQLAGHIAHKAQVDEVGDGWELHIGDGLGRVIPRDNALELVAEAESPEMLERIKDVLGRHLLQFTTKLPGVTIAWTDSSVAS